MSTALMATAGIATLYVVDQHVYQRLLQTAFDVGLRTEQLGSRLPLIRTLMVLSASGSGMARRLRFFYLIPMTAPAEQSASAGIRGPF